MFIEADLMPAVAAILLLLTAIQQMRRQFAHGEFETGICFQADYSGNRTAGGNGSSVQNDDRRLSDEALANEKLLAEIWEREKAQEKLKATVLRFKALFEMAPDAVFLKSEGGKIIDANLAAENIFGYTRLELTGKDIRDLAPGGRNWTKPGYCGVGESEGVAKDGRVFPIEVSAQSISLDDGPSVLLIVRDVTERKKAVQELKTLTMALEQSPSTVVITDTEGRIVYVNSRFTETTGYTKHEVNGMDMSMLISDDQPDTFYCKMWDTITSGKQWRGEISCKTKDGRKIWELASISPVTEDAGNIRYYVAVKEDITEKKRRERMIKRIALYDSLTNLPNRALLMDRLDLALAQTERNGERTAVMYLDLDGFKTVNDSFGHEAGDKVLTEAGKRISASVRKSDTAARIGGDEFVIVLRNVKRLEDVDATATRIIESLDKPFQVSGRTVILGASIGVSLAPDHSRDRDELIRMADQAMYRVKEAGKNDYRYFDSPPGDWASA